MMQPSKRNQVHVAVGQKIFEDGKQRKILVKRLERQSDVLEKIRATLKLNHEPIENISYTAKEIFVNLLNNPAVMSHLSGLRKPQFRF